METVSLTLLSGKDGGLQHKLLKNSHFEFLAWFVEILKKVRNVVTMSQSPK